MSVDTTVVLGDVSFAYLEVPAGIRFGGRQCLATHKLVGGARVVQSLGPDDRELEWSGYFTGPSAGARARHLDYLRRQGSRQTLTWDQYRYDVVIESFEADFQRFYHIPYRIECLVVEDLTLPVSVAPDPPCDQAKNDNLDSLGGYASGLSAFGLDPAVVSNVQSSIGQVQQVTGALSSFTGISPSVLGKINSAIYAGQASVSGGIAALNGNIGGVLTAGGVVASASGSKNATALIQQVNQFQAMAGLTQMQGHLGVLSRLFGTC